MVASVRVSRELLASIERLARERGVSRSESIVWLLERGVRSAEWDRSVERVVASGRERSRS